MSLGADDVRAAVADRVPGPIHQYWVDIGGERWPVKEAFSRATGLPHTLFTSQTAQRHLGRLGFVIGSGSRALPGVPGAAGDASVRRVPVRRAPVHDGAGTTAGTGDVLLVGCVKSKRAHGAAAKDLYTSAYFTKMRRFAEASGRPWFILSAEHGLVLPDEWLEPYDCYLPDTTPAYRARWGGSVAERLESVVGPLKGVAVEIHAGSTYVDAAAGPLGDRGATVTDPLRGLTLGQRLSWYGAPSGARSQEVRERTTPVVTADELTAWLRDEARATSLADFLAEGRAAWMRPGMYSWWIDDDGAAELSRGLGAAVVPGLVYTGLAGATRSGGASSTNTLWGRVATMHLGRNHRMSTLRLSLGAVLCAAYGQSTIDENELTRWMHAHLRIVAVPVDDRDALDALETAVLSRLDPPLNLAKVPATPIRRRLSELRALVGARAARGARG